MALTKEERYVTMLDEANEQIKDYLEDIETVDSVYEGDYSPQEMVSWADDMHYVKTHLLFDMVRRTTSMLMPPPFFEFICEPANVEETADDLSSETAKSILEYTFNKKGGARKIREAITGMLLHNRGYARVGFRADPSVDLVSEVDPNTVESSGEDKQLGQAYFETVKPKDLRIARGYASIEDAWCAGGWVARQFFPHLEWVKKNEVYKNNRDIKADTEYKGKEPEVEQQKREEYPIDKDLEYVALWEIFIAPTPKKPLGQYVIFSKIQRKILYEADAMPFEGVGFPIREVAQYIPRDGYYGTPLAKRSLNPLFEHEWFESQKLILADESKEIIILDGSAPDTAEAELEKQGSLIIARSTNLGGQDVQHISIQNDPSAVQSGSLNALARFERMWGFSGTEARIQGGKIATEMVIENKIFMSEINDLMVRVHHFIEDISCDLMAINKQFMSEEEQLRITRKMNNTWTDRDPVTLEGNYSINIKSKPLYDMTDGEYGSVMQQILSMGAQLEQMPKYASRIDVLDIYKQWVDRYGIATNKLINEEQPLATQAGELTLMLSAIPIPINPDDDDVEHLTVIQEFFGVLEQTEQATYDEKNIQLIQQHAQMHEQQLQQKQGGSAGASQFNPTNEARSAGAENVSGGAVNGQLQNGAN